MTAPVFYLVGFDTVTLTRLRPVLERHNYDVRVSDNPQLGVNEAPDGAVALLDYEHNNASEFLDRLYMAGVKVIALGDGKNARQAVGAVEQGASKFLARPLSLELLWQAVEAVQHESQPRHSTSLIGKAPALCDVRGQLKRLARFSGGTILIQGETGTGKNLAAKTLHQMSRRADAPFVEINCAALPDTLLESELFGHEKGAFTDATRDKQGLLEVANGGTVFLDEIDSMSVGLQAKLLQFLESRQVRRVGSTQTKRVSVRVICATNADLETLSDTGAFRRDLLYRIKVVALRMPPLRELVEDLSGIAESLLPQIAADLGILPPRLAPEAAKKLVEHSWPGNVRELRNVLERAIIFSDSMIISQDAIQFDTSPSEPVLNEQSFVLENLTTLEDLERSYIQHILARFPQKSYHQIARLLGVTKKTLFNKRQRYDLHRIHVV